MMHRQKILSIEDNEELQEVIKQALETEGHEVLTASSAEQGLEKLEVMPVDIVLLDLMLPDEDGFALLKKIREKTSAHIIIISGKGEITDKIVGLEMGADDYITKPFEMRELYARIKAVTRRGDKKERKGGAGALSEAIKVRFGHWVLDRGRYDLFTEEGAPVGLTTAEFKLLEALVNNPQRTLSRDKLFEITRGTEYEAYDRAVDIHIARIRKKLGDDPQTPQYIKTVRGVGYMFCGEVKPEFDMARRDARA